MRGVGILSLLAIAELEGTLSWLCTVCCLYQVKVGHRLRMHHSLSSLSPLGLDPRNKAHIAATQNRVDSIRQCTGKTLIRCQMLPDVAG